MPAIVSTATALPPHRYEQPELMAAMQRLGEASGAPFDADVIARFFRSVRVKSRCLALPLERYFTENGFGQKNDAWISVALDLGESAIRRVLEEAELEAEQVELFITTSVTGIAVPSIDARLMNRLPFAATTKRLPLFGLGCAAGAAGVARAADYLVGHPREIALLLSVELCSLTVQPGDLSIANIVAAGLFGDGAAAVLIAGDEHPAASRGPRVLDFRSVLFPKTERVMGWDIVDTGFKIVLSSGVPELAKVELPRVVRSFLSNHRLRIEDIDHFIAHPGGPAVIEAMQRGLELPEGALALSLESLELYGNLSSASVLFILDETLRRRPRIGERGLLLAMGPGFGAEVVLLQW